MPDLEIQLTTRPLRISPPDWDGRFGAESSFVGVVRRVEAGREIRGIDYSAYLPMAERSLRGLGARASELFGEHRAKITHRIGFVAAAEPSVEIQVSAPHSGEAFDITRWYLAEIKAQTPIWKEVVPIAGDA